MAATYCVDSGAWALLVDHPLFAYLFVIICPAAGVGGVLCVASELESDAAKRFFRLGVAAATLLIDGEGREIGRLLGPAEWDGEDAKRLIGAALK